MKSKILTLILSVFLLTQTAMAASPYSARAKTKRIPEGTQFCLKLLSPLSSYKGSQGAEFSAIMLTDQTADNDVILPMGSLVRGNISKITPSKRMSKGSILYLDFDHVVTPNGRQLPLAMSIIGRSDMTYDGGITTTKGYKDAMKLSWKKSVDIAKNSTEWGNETFEDFAGGYFRILTVPLSALGGGLGAGGYIMYDSVADMIKKGKDVQLYKGDVIKVILTQPIDVPVI